MNRPGLHSAQFWHQRAEEAHVRADEMHDGDARRTMRQIARMYSAMATRMEIRELELRSLDRSASVNQGATGLH